MQWRLKSPASPLFAQLTVQALIKENITAPRHWPLCGEFIGDPHKRPVMRKMFPFDDVIMSDEHLKSDTPSCEIIFHQTARKKCLHVNPKMLKYISFSALNVDQKYGKMRREILKKNCSATTFIPAKPGQFVTSQHTYISTEGTGQRQPTVITNHKPRSVILFGEFTW